MPPSSNGRTRDSQSRNTGSNPVGGTKNMAPSSRWSRTPDFQSGNAGFKSRRCHQKSVTRALKNEQCIFVEMLL